MEYHGFGIISEGIESGCHYMIAGVQGDWTKALVNDPPTHLYTRQLKVRIILPRNYPACVSFSPCSSRVYRTLLISTAAVSQFALGPGSAPCCQHVSN